MVLKRKIDIAGCGEQYVGMYELLFPGGGGGFNEHATLFGTSGANSGFLFPQFSAASLH